jgi:2-methylcitrate dehydratase PrpD
MMSETTILQKLANYATSLRFEELPADVVSKANDCFFDLIGCYFAALGRPENRDRAERIMAFNPAPEAIVWGTGKYCGIAEAALAIGTLGYDLEYDDGISLGGHWGSASIPATALSVIRNGGAGQDLLAGIVASYEVGTRISRIYSPRLLQKHVHFPCVMGAFAAAVGYLRGARGLAAQLAGALSLAGLFPLGTYSTAISGAPGKGLYSGWPNFLGVQAARLADIGLSGDLDVLENRDGFGNVFGLGPADEAARQTALEGLGHEYRFMEVYFKPYPCCRWLHAPIHAALRIIGEHGLSREDVAGIRVSGPEFILMYDKRTGFESKVTCQYSIPYSVGAAVYFGRLGPGEYESDVRNDPGLRVFIERIEVGVDEELQGIPAVSFRTKVDLTCKDGRRFSTLGGLPWSRENPPAKQELVEKFVAITKDVLSQEEQEIWADLYRKGMESPDAWAVAVKRLHEKR